MKPKYGFQSAGKISVILLYSQAVEYNIIAAKINKKVFLFFYFGIMLPKKLDLHYMGTDHNRIKHHYLYRLYTF